MLSVALRRLSVLAVLAIAVVAVFGFMGRIGPPRPDSTLVASIATHVNGPGDFVGAKTGGAVLFGQGTLVVSRDVNSLYSSNEILSSTSVTTTNNTYLSLRHNGENYGTGTTSPVSLSGVGGNGTLVSGEVASAWADDPVAAPPIRRGDAGLKSSSNPGGMDPWVLAAAGLAVFVLAGLASLKFATRR